MLMNFSRMAFLIPEKYLSCDEQEISMEIEQFEETEEELCLI